MSESLEVIDVAARVGEALERAGIEYTLGGSVATSVQGEPRSTNDIDFAVRLRLDQVDSFIEALGPAFDVDSQSMREAVKLRRSMNLFHLPSMTKVDVFVRGDDAFERALAP